MGHFDAGIGVIELFYPDLADAKAFYQNVLELPVDREDDTSVSFVLGEQVVILLGPASAQELVAPVPVAGPGSGTRCVSPSQWPTSTRPARI